jgi:hypothetical protein
VLAPVSENPQYRDNVVRVYDPDTDTLLRTDVVTDTFYTYTYENNTKDNSIFNRGPQRKFKIAVTVRDNLGRESRPATISPENPVPAGHYPDAYRRHGSDLPAIHPCPTIRISSAPSFGRARARASIR